MPGRSVASVLLLALHGLLCLQLVARAEIDDDDAIKEGSSFHLPIIPPEVPDGAAERREEQLPDDLDVPGAAATLSGRECGRRQGRLAGPERCRLGGDEQGGVADQASGFAGVDVQGLDQQRGQGAVPGLDHRVGAGQRGHRNQRSVPRGVFGGDGGRARVQRRHGGGARRRGVVHPPSIERVF